MNVTSSSEALRAYRDASSNNLFSIRHAKRVTTRCDSHRQFEYPDLSGVYRTLQINGDRYYSKYQK